MFRLSGTAFDAVLALAIRAASASLVFLMQVLLARLMPGETYGGFVTLWTWMLAVGSFAALGFAESSVRFLPRYHLRRRNGFVRAFWRFGFGLVLIGSVVLAAVAIGVALALGPQQGLGFMVLLVALGLPFLAMEYYLEGVARSFGWFRLATVPIFIIRPLMIIGTCLFLSWQGVALSLPVVAAVLIGSMALITVFIAVLLVRRLGKLAPEGAEAGQGQKRLWLMASLPLLLLSGLEDLSGYADILVLSLLAEPEHVGIYFAAARSLALAGFVAYAMTLVSGRRFALDLAGKSRELLQASVLQSTRMTFWATLASVIVALIAGPFLLGAFGAEFLDGYGVMAVLGAGMMVRALSGQAGEALIVLGRQREGVMIGLGVLLVTAAIAFALVPVMGIYGAAIASAAAMACRSLALAGTLYRLEGLRVLSVGLPDFRRAPA